MYVFLSYFVLIFFATRKKKLEEKLRRRKKNKRTKRNHFLICNSISVITVLFVFDMSLKCLDQFDNIFIQIETKI